MKITLFALALIVLIQGQAINSVSFKSYPDNDFTKCVFVIQLSDDDYTDDFSGEQSIVSTAQAGYVGYVEVFHGKDEANPVDGNSGLSCTYSIASLGSNNLDETFIISDNGCTIYNDYEEEISEVLEGEIYLERIAKGLVWSEQIIITVYGDNDQWEGWLKDSESDDFQVCYT